jgi:hypothetical protein
MLKLQCKTTINSVFVGKKNHQKTTYVLASVGKNFIKIEQELTLE